MERGWILQIDRLGMEKRFTIWCITGTQEFCRGFGIVTTYYRLVFIGSRFFELFETEFRKQDAY